MPKAKAAKEKPAPRQKRLPEMDDPMIEELEAAAETYADHRDERIRVQRKELDQKDVLLKIMKRHRKTAYHHDGYEIEILPEGEKLRVRVNKDGEE